VSGPEGFFSRVPRGRWLFLLVIPIIAASVAGTLWLTRDHPKATQAQPTIAAVAASTQAAVPSALGAAAESSAVSAVTNTPSTPAARVLSLGSQALVVDTGGVGVRLRSGPGLSSAKLTVLPEGTALKIVGGPRDSDGYRWWEVRGNNVSGWVAGEFLTPAQ
jgi:hypothetical protein